MLVTKVERHEGFIAYQDVVARTPCRQATADRLVEAYAAGRSLTRIVDLGCGDGRSLDLFERILPGADWYGLDVADSPEARHRQRLDNRFVVFNGTDLPFEEDCVDLVFSKQVLHHVQNPAALLADVERVLKPGGAFIGSTSCLEVYQSRSLRSYTPFGLKELLTASGLERITLYPGVDGLTLFFYHLCHEPAWFYRFFNGRSPLNAMFDAVGWLFRLEDLHRNFLKIQFAGHLGFIAFKPQN